MKYFKSCIVCGATYEKNPHWGITKWEKSKFCSLKCCWENKKGNTPWNKDRNLTKKEKLKISIATKKAMRKLGFFDEGHPNWKGENAGIKPKHQWVKRHKGIAIKCEHCKKTKKNGTIIDWANINHQYKRNLDDYIQLCRSCHRKYDIIYNNYKIKLLL